MIRAERLFKTYGRRFPITAVQETTFALDKGDALGILGPRGAGKTTLLRMLATTLRPTSGHVTVGGFDTVRETAKARDLLGFVPEFLDLHFWRTGHAFMQFWGRLSGIRGKRLASSLDSLVQLLQVADVLDEDPRSYSVGAHRRFMLLQALLSEPQVLILDEPLAPLMGQERDSVVRVLQELRRRGLTLTVSSPHLRDVQPVCDHVAIMYGGRLTRAFETQDLLRRVGEKRHARIFVHAEDIPSHAITSLRRLDGVIDVRSAVTATVVYTMPGKATANQVAEALKRDGVPFHSVREAEVTLGDVLRAIWEEAG